MSLRRQVEGTGGRGTLRIKHDLELALDVEESATRSQTTPSRWTTPEEDAGSR
jgi:hypothetical protein